MSITVIWASPNTDGLTATIKNSFVAGLESTGVKAEIINFNKLKIKRCLICDNGWGICESQGKCVIKDSFEELYNKLRSADGIVWIVPVYWHDLPEHVKSFLDRLRRCENAYNHFLQGKKNLMIACAGGTGYGAIQCLDKFEVTLGHMKMITVERLPVTQFNKNYMIPAVLEAGKKFSEMINS